MNSVWYKHTLSSAADTHDSRWMMLSVSAITLSTHTHTHSLTCRSSDAEDECLTQHRQDQDRDRDQDPPRSGWEDAERAWRARYDDDHRNERWEMKYRTMAVFRNLRSFLPRQHFRATLCWILSRCCCNSAAFLEKMLGACRMSTKICCLGGRLWCLKCCLGRNTRF